MDKVKELEQAIEALVNMFYEETKIPIASINPKAIHLTLNGGEPKLYGYNIKIKVGENNFDALIKRIEYLIKQGTFNKDYLEE